MSITRFQPELVGIAAAQDYPNRTIRVITNVSAGGTCDIFVRSLDGELMQSSSTSEMIFGVAEQVSHLSSRVTLLPGDLVMTSCAPLRGSQSHHGWRII